MNPPTWHAHITAHNDSLTLSGFVSEGDAFEVAGWLAETIAAHRPGQVATVDAVEHARCASCDESEPR